jgi:hypothetical protein
MTAAVRALVQHLVQFPVASRRSLDRRSKREQRCDYQRESASGPESSRHSFNLSEKGRIFLSSRRPVEQPSSHREGAEEYSDKHRQIKSLSP